MIFAHDLRLVPSTTMKLLNFSLGHVFNLSLFWITHRESCESKLHKVSVSQSVFHGTLTGVRGEIAEVSGSTPFGKWC